MTSTGSHQVQRTAAAPRRTRRLRVLAGAIGTLVVLGTAACGGGDSEDGSRTFSNAPTPTFGQPTTTPPPKPYVVKFVEQPNCQVRGIRDERIQNKITCGQLMVPEDRSDPGRKTVALQVAYIESTNPNKQPDPVLYLEGGPGGSALASLELWTIPPTPLLGDRDLIIMDQRGTGYSEPRFNCNYELTLVGTGESTMTAGAFADEQAQAVMDCFKRLNAGAYQLSAYSTIDAAADIEDLRKYFEIEKLNLFGISYGTRLALQYMNDFPDSVRSAVLDSSYPAEPNLFAEGPINGWRALDAVFSACADNPTCNRANPDLVGALIQVINQLDAEPFTFKAQKLNNQVVEYLYAGEDFVSDLFSAMYDSAAAQVIPRVITMAKSDPIGAVNMLYDSIGLTIDATDDVSRRPGFANGLFYLLSCTEEIPFNDVETMDGLADWIPEPIKTKFLENRKKIFNICSAWTLPPRELAITDAPIPTLVLAGTFDPITPPRWGRIAAGRLPDATYVEVEGAGHGVYFSGDCGRDVVVNFITDPASQKDASCEPVLNVG